MRVHANQLNPYAQLDAFYAAQRAAAKQEAANTRRKLTEFASLLAGECDSEQARVPRVEAREENKEQNKPRTPQEPGSRKKQKQAAASGKAGHSISEWA